MKVDKFIFPADFIVLDMEDDSEVSIILGHPFFTIGRALINVQQRKLTLCVNEEEVIFNIYRSMNYPDGVNTCCRVDTMDETATKIRKLVLSKDYLDKKEKKMHCDVASYAQALNILHVLYSKHDNMTLMPVKEIKEIKPYLFGLKQLPVHLSYPFLEESSTYPMIIVADLTELEREKILRVLRMHKSTIDSQLVMEESYSPFVEHQRMFNPTMIEIIKVGVLKLLDAGIIYII